MDSKKAGTYTLTYNASDAAGHEATATRTVTVSDTKAPVIASDTTAKDLAENSGPGQAVYTIAANDAGGVTDYAIGGTDDSHLSVNSTTGVVTLTANPDYETKPSYSFTVTASDAAGNTSVAKEVTFSITDVDEIAPTITSEATATNLAENSGAGQTVYTITATDDVAVTSYAIAGTDASYLSVNSSTGVVTLTANPDYEAKPSYSFTVTARDGAGNTSVAKEVTFSITDVDEDAPMITLKGNASIALAVGDSFTDPGYSAIDAVDGNLTSRIVVTGTVDSNKAGTYTLTYNVSDTGGNKAEPVTRTVTVLATKAPVIILKGNASIALAVGDSFTDPGYSAIDAVDGNLTSRIVVTGTVDSNKAGTYTLTYNVSDTGGNKAEPVTRTVTVLATKAPVIILKGNASIALAVGDSFTDPGYSAIDAVDGNLTSRIVVTGTVDSNKAGTYTLTYNVSDTGGNKAEPVTRTVTVLATKAPMITLKGNASIALAVGDSFTDPGYSAIDAVDGNLTSRIVVTGTVNSNKAGTYTLTYNVSDTGGNKAEPVTRTVTVLATKAPVIILKGNASIALAVGDSFTDPGYSAIDVVDGNLTSSIVVTGTVDSNKAGTYTLTYNVSDTGGNKAEPVTRTVTVLATKAPMITLKGNASIALAVGDSFTDPGYSAIDAVDGNLTSSIVVTGTVDSNKAGIYTLTYNVSDTGGNKAAPVTRTVTVLDIKAPVITSGTTATNLAENSGAGQTVYTITATDDVGVTSYAIGGTDATSLALTGAVVTLKANPDYETKSSYSFTVTASDAAGNTSEAKTVTFSITDVDEIAPTITSEATATNLAENSGAGQTVYTITATDDVAVTSYAIAGTDASYLSVNSSTGVVTLTADPDYETKPSYNFTVTASDSANTSAATMVTFSITNIEDQTPVITSGTTAPNLAENSGAGQTVYTITATDDVAVTSYAIGGTDASYLSVNSSTGVVTLTADPDYETKPSYSFTVTASDSANTSAATTVTFSITNIEDQAPVITSGTTATNLAENSGAGQTVYTITATDDVAVTSYAIAGTDASYLSVNGSTGVVTLTADPDYETKPSYSFTVTASDSANTSAATTVTFSITNIEDQAPVITSGTTATNLAENSGAGQTVYTITATDDVAVTSYAIAGTDASYLSVNGSTGVVTLTADPDYETKPSYSFTATASDSANTSAATTVTFSITDVDEVAPVITLAGNASITLEVGDSFTDPGATAQDAVDGDLTSSIVVTGTVDLNTVGTYTLTYNVSDGAGNAAVEVVRTVIVEPVSIRLIIPEDIVVTASGYLTAVNLDPDSVASGADGDGNPLLVSVDQTGPFVSGTHQIVWSVSDGNRRVSATQILKVVPLVTTAVATYADEGVSISIAFLLSGEAADYPVTVPFSLSGTAVEGEDYSIDVSDRVTIDKGTRGNFNLTITADELLEGQETIEISLSSPTNAVAGLPQRQVITIIEENIAPQLGFVVSQVTDAGGPVISTIVAADAGDVTITPEIEDPNHSDTHVMNWDDALDRLPSALVDPETQSLTFDPETLLGVYSINAGVTDSGNPPYYVTDTVLVKVIATAPTLADGQDTDGDGIPDSEEGTVDSDGDNVPDYLDAISASHILVLNNSSQTLSMSIPGIQLGLGALAQAQGDHDALISEDFMVSQDIAKDISYDYPVGLAAFVSSGAQSGYSYPVVHSLGDKVIPEGAVYRKYLGKNIGWQNFVENAVNEVRSTFAQQGDCPAAYAENFSEGITAGHNCVFLLIEDGGPNDVDGVANGTLVDPGGIAVKYIGVPSANSQVVLDEHTLVANGTDTTAITVWAYDEQQSPLLHMQVTATTHIPGVTVSNFVDQGDGSYIATITAGSYSGSGLVWVTIDNGDAAVTLLSELLALTAVPVVRTSGGCTVATGRAMDSSMILVMLVLLLLRFRRRGALNVSS